MRRTARKLQELQTRSRFRWEGRVGPHLPWAAVDFSPGPKTAKKMM